MQFVAIYFAGIFTFTSCHLNPMSKFSAGGHCTISIHYSVAIFLQSRLLCMIMGSWYSNDHFRDAGLGGWCYWAALKGIHSDSLSRQGDFHIGGTRCRTKLQYRTCGHSKTRTLHISWFFLNFCRRIIESKSYTIYKQNSVGLHQMWLRGPFHHQSNWPISFWISTIV